MKGNSIILMSCYHRFIVSITTTTFSRIVIYLWSSHNYLVTTFLNSAYLRISSFLISANHHIYMFVTFTICLICFKVESIIKAMRSLFQASIFIRITRSKILIQMSKSLRSNTSSPLHLFQGS